LDLLQFLDFDAKDRFFGAVIEQDFLVGILAQWSELFHHFVCGHEISPARGGFV
jgi:hypothetical protein